MTLSIRKLFRSAETKLNNAVSRDEFVRQQLQKLPPGALLLDAGCGSQRYRPACAHLQYRGQDFGQFTNDDKKIIGSEGAGGPRGYQYGKLDYVGDIWAIAEQDRTFDAILCTEVIEHIPYPNETIAEFSRLLKPGGVLILTAPSNCLRHMDPYFFYSGFTDRWFESTLGRNGLAAEHLEAVGDYYSWMAAEVARTAASHSLMAKMLLAPAFGYYYLKKPTTRSVDTLCMGYHVVARKQG